MVLLLDRFSEKPTSRHDGAAAYPSVLSSRFKRFLSLFFLKFRWKRIDTRVIGSEKRRGEESLRARQRERERERERLRNPFRPIKVEDEKR